MAYIVGSFPITLAKDPRFGQAKVARELCGKSYNSSRKESNDFELFWIIIH